MNLQTTTKRVPRRRFVTLPEVARRRGVSRVAVLYAIRAGTLRAYRVDGSRSWLISRSDAEVYVNLPRRRAKST